MLVCQLNERFQIEQDTTMLMGSCIADPKTTFMQQWTTVYVPAILSYAEKNKKKNIVGYLASMNKAGTSGSQLV